MKKDVILWTGAGQIGMAIIGYPRSLNALRCVNEAEKNNK